MTMNDLLLKFFIERITSVLKLDVEDESLVAILVEDIWDSSTSHVLAVADWQKKVH